MAYDPGAIDSTLFAAVGDDPKLIADLRQAFADGVKRAMAAVETAGDEDEWRGAALRLKGLAASFGAVRLMAAADAAIGMTAGDPAALQRLRRAMPRG